MGLIDLFKKKNKNASVLKYEKALMNSSKNFNEKLTKLASKYKEIDSEYFEELEEILMSADIGVKTVIKIIDKIEERTKKENIKNPNDLREIIVDELFVLYVSGDILSSKLNLEKNKLSTVLFVGVNGVGKTTSIAKIANRLKNENKKVLLVAGDTFRAGAIEQIEKWGEKLEIEVFKSTDKDPSAIVFKAITYASDSKFDVVLIDTAGRLQTKKNLMQELEKMNKVIEKTIGKKSDETLLVVDATTGQNAISQASSFSEVTDITGIVLTKLDGTAKGGIVLAIKEELNIPVKFIGLGEKAEDMEPFDIDKYLYGLFKEWENEK